MKCRICNLEHEPHAYAIKTVCVTTLRDRVAQQKHVGGLMSNVFFNWSQQDRFTADERKMMKELQAKWDVL